ncbi:MAG: organic solvent tolerance protein [Acidobacteria bacterium]|nr:organic solvent tolerance protein [Acidobacteriota bacterium]
MSKRGLMLGGEFRHLSETSRSRLRGEILPHDRDEPDLGARWAVSAQHRQTWDGFTGDVNYNQVSDDLYLSDFGRGLAQSSARYLTRRASLGYGGNGWSLSALVSDYQNVDPTTNPYRILPGIAFNGGYAETVAGQPINLAVGATWTNFDRDLGVTGQRLDIYPYLTMPYRTSWGYAPASTAASSSSGATSGSARASRRPSSRASTTSTFRASTRTTCRSSTPASSARSTTCTSWRTCSPAPTASTTRTASAWVSPRG